MILPFVIFHSAICQVYQESSNSFSSLGIPTSPPSELIVSSFELLPNRTAAQVCLISKVPPVFSISNNKVTCKFVITSLASPVPNLGYLGTFQEFVDCTGAMSNRGTLCDGCDVCRGNGSTCNADCDNAVASGRKFDDCSICGGSTFYFPNKTFGLPWEANTDDQQMVDGLRVFQSIYCPGSFVRSVLRYSCHTLFYSHSHIYLSSGSSQYCNAGHTFRFCSWVVLFFGNRCFVGERHSASE